MDKAIPLSELNEFTYVLISRHSPDVISVIKDIEGAINSENSITRLNSIFMDQDYKHKTDLENKKKGFKAYAIYHAALNDKMETFLYLTNSEQSEKYLSEENLNHLLLSVCSRELKNYIPPLLSLGASLHYHNERIFDLLFEMQKTEMLDYLIFDLEIEKTARIEEHYCAFFPEIEKKFAARDLQKKLENNLKNVENKKQRKI